MLPTRNFLAPMAEDEEIEVELSQGNTIVIKYKAMSELQSNGMRYDGALSCLLGGLFVPISSEGLSRANIFTST